jgi:hypothetical protein
MRSCALAARQWCADQEIARFVAAVTTVFRTFEEIPGQLTPIFPHGFDNAKYNGGASYRRQNERRGYARLKEDNRAKSGNQKYDSADDDR